MKFIIFLSFIALSSLSGCQRDKMSPKDLTSANVIRELPPANTEATSPAQTPTRETTPEVKTAPGASLTVKPVTPAKSYHIIVASHPNEKLAQENVARLKAQGYTDAQIITKDQRYRVSIANDPDKQEATKKRNELALRLKQEDIWITLY